jgi:hypothetical protein
MARKTTDPVQLKLRFQEGLRRRLDREAKRNGRSLNSEIIHRLQRTLAIDDSTAATNVLDFFRELGVDITKANEKDVAVALGKLVGDRFLGVMPIQETKSHERDDK